MAQGKKGFFGRLFARKPGGTRLGNLIRQVAYNNTYGIAGKDLGMSYGEILLNDLDLKK